MRLPLRKKSSRKLPEPNLRAKEDEQHPCYRKNKSNQHASQNSVESKLSCFGFSHLFAVGLASGNRSLLLFLLSADALVMPGHAVYVHVANHTAVVIEC